MITRFFDIGISEIHTKPADSVPDKEAYAICRMRCACGKLNLLITSGGETFCKACGRHVEFVPKSAVYRKVEDLTKNLGTVTDTDYSDELREKISSLENDIVDRETDLEESKKLLNEYRDKIRDLELRLREASADRTEKEDLRKENTEIKESMKSAVEALQSEMSAIRKDNDRLASENTELETTNRHMTAEMNKAKSFDLRGIIEIFMEYTAEVNNIVSGNRDEDCKKKLINARTMQLGMKLKGKGLYMSHHAPGEPLGNGRIDCTDSPTDDLDLNMKVLRSNRFGCSFAQETYAPIAEAVVVNRFIKPEEEKE